MATVEHALPVPVLYQDVLELFAKSGTGYTPTHIVNYGGAFGEQFVWSHYDAPDDPKLVLRAFIIVLPSQTTCRLRRFTRHDILEGITESTSRPRNCESLMS